MKKDDKIRFRVLAETFSDIPPIQKEQLLARKAAIEAGGDPTALKSSLSPSKSPYLLTVILAMLSPNRCLSRLQVSIAEDGLGVLDWWDY